MSQELTCNAGNVTLGTCNTVVGSPNIITGVVEYDNYGYLLSSWSVYVFLAVFIVAFLAHLVLGTWKRTWWVIATMGAGTALEVIGWGGRLWSKTDTYWNPNFGGTYVLNFNGFIMQICCLVIGPTFYSAANYILLGRLIRATGPEHVSLAPASFAKLFMIADFICLVVQAVGGGMAGTANTSQGSNNGGYIMTAGVVLQLFITLIFLLFLFEFLYRKSRNSVPRKQFNPLPSLKCWGQRNKHDSTSSSTPMTELKSAPGISPEIGFAGEAGMAGGHVKFGLTIFMICLTTLLIIIRSFYRSIELGRGWNGPLAVSEPVFLGMDALLMALVAWSYAIIHPSFLLGSRRV